MNLRVYCRVVWAAAALAATLFLHANTAVAACGGHGNRDSLLVSTVWLAGHLKDPGLVVLAIGQKSEYDAAHIPGSQFLNYPDIYLPKGPEGLRVELPPIDRLADVFEKLGVTNDSRIILYPLKDWNSPTARVYVTLDALGFGARTSILDGSLPLWQSENRPVTTEVAAIRRGQIEPCPQADVIAKLDFVRSNVHHAGVAIVDARDPGFYTGAQIPRGKRAGHIPGAANITFSTLVDDQGRLLPVETLKAKFREAGVASGDRVVSYCHIGQQASLVYFVARYLGYDARMYDGSWDEWSDHSELAAETGSAHQR